MMEATDIMFSITAFREKKAPRREFHSLISPPLLFVGGLTNEDNDEITTLVSVSV